MLNVFDKVKYKTVSVSGKIEDRIGTIHCISKDKLTGMVIDDNDNIARSVYLDSVELLEPFVGEVENIKLAENTTKSDQSSHWFDSHYAEQNVQPMDVVCEWPVEQQIGFYRGNILKYIVRLGHKDKALPEARKVLRYAQWLVAVLEGKTINPRE